MPWSGSERGNLSGETSKVKPKLHTKSKLYLQAVNRRICPQVAVHYATFVVMSVEETVIFDVQKEHLGGAVLESRHNTDTLCIAQSNIHQT